MYVAVADFTPLKGKKTGQNQIPLQIREAVKVVRKADNGRKRRLWYSSLCYHDSPCQIWALGSSGCYGNTLLVAMVALLWQHVTCVIPPVKGWWYVCRTDPDRPDCGYVPSSFLKPIGSADIPLDPQQVKDCLGFVTSNVFDFTSDSESPAASLMGTFIKFVAIDAYESTNEVTLSFPDGAILTVIEQSEDGGYGREGGREEAYNMEWPLSRDESWLLCTLPTLNNHL